MPVIVQKKGKGDKGYVGSPYGYGEDGGRSGNWWPVGVVEEHAHHFADRAEAKKAIRTFHPDERVDDYTFRKVD